MRDYRTGLRRLKGATWESAEAYRTLAETAPDALVTIDEASTILVVNPRVGELFGYDDAELVGSRLTALIPDYLHRLHSATVEQNAKTGPQHNTRASVECTGLHRSGRELSLEVSFGEFTREGQHYFTGIIRDISVRKHAERQLAAQHAVTRILDASDSLQQAAPQILQTLCEHLCCELGALWGVEREAGMLRVVEIWHPADISVEGFEKRSRELSLRLGASLPGRVWQSRAPVWLFDLRADEDCPRVGELAEAGLGAAFAFPVTLGGEVLGVVELFSREEREPDAGLFAMVASVGSQMGQFIERKSAQDALREAKEELERRVAGRTAELVEANARLKREVAERRQSEKALRASEERFRRFSEASSGGVVIHARGVIVEANSTAALLCGYEPDEVIGMPIIAFVAPECHELILNNITAGVETTCEVVAVRKDGSTFPVRLTSKNYKHNGQQVRMILFHDITERRQAEESLRQSARDYRMLYEQAHDAIIIFIPENEIVLDVNKRACEIYGYSRSEFIGMSIEAISKDVARGRLRVTETLERGDYLNFETIQYRKDGTEMFLEINAAVVNYRNVRAILSINRDITERKYAEEERAQLLRRLVAAQEEERRRIALELHDQVGQFSTALMLGLRSLKNSGDPPRDGPVEQLMHLTGQFGQEMHRLAWELRPSSLDDHGLQAALASYVEEWSARSGVAVDFHSGGLEDRRLPAQVETVVYRIVQEALTNVAKHAGARRVGVIMECRPRRVRIIVEDDGRGFDLGEVLKATETQHRMGLVGMHERALMVGGDVEIESSPGDGTTIFLSIPLTPAKENKPVNV